MSFHISKNGKPARCTAQPGNCRLKESDGQPMPHFQDENTAMEYIELKAEAEEANSRYGGAISKKDSSKKSSEDGKLTEEKLLKLTIQDQKNLAVKGTFEEKMLIAKNINKVPTETQFALLDPNKDMYPEVLEKAMETSNRSLIKEKANDHKNAPVSEFMNDKKLAKIGDLSWGNNMANAKRMNKKLYDRMNKSIKKEKKIETSDKDNFVNPRFVAESLKHGKFSDTEKKEILESDPDVMKTYIEIDPNNKILNNVKK